MKDSREAAIADIIAERDRLRVLVSDLKMNYENDRARLAAAIARLVLEVYELKDVINMRKED